MNAQKNQQKKDLVIKMIKEIATLQFKAPKNVADKLDYILTSFLQDALDFEMGIRYIDSNLRRAKDNAEKIFWIQVIKVIRKYFDASKQIKD